MTWFILSLIAILFWSGSDLFSKLGSRPDDKYSHWKIVMGAHAFFLIATGTPFSISDIVTYLPASAMYILSMILGYAGLRYIELSISSPICNSSGAVAALLCFFILKETMSGLQFFAVALVCVGVFALSYIEKKQDDALRRREGDTPDKKHTRSFLAILFPILYCIIDGLGTFADALLLDTVIAEEQANIAYELTFLFAAVVSFVYVKFIRHDRFLPKREGPKYVGALFETAGQFAYIYAIADEDHVMYAAPIISAYCAASVLLDLLFGLWSRIFLREKLSWRHYLMLLLIVIGIVLIGILDL